jgi:hypothetical protein
MDAKPARGEFFYTVEDGNICVWFGNPKEPEAEFVIQTSVRGIPKLIATLKFIQEKES